MTQPLRIRHALISVSDKSGAIELATALRAHGAKILSTGGTAAVLQKGGIEVTDLDDFYQAPPLLGGRVKTLHSAIFAGVLADNNDNEHRRELKALGLPKIDLVAVNFYPFEAAVAGGADKDTLVENIDIGGPSLVRAAAKNCATTAVLTDPADYPAFVGALQRDGGVSAEYCRQLATKAFVQVAHLDSQIANYHAGAMADGFADHQFFHLEKIVDLPYGENPHQRAACYTLAGATGGFTQLQGNLVSYNNILDAHAARRAVNLHDAPTVAIIKHNTPCGLATAETLTAAFTAALRTDPISAYGGVIAVNRAMDGDTAKLLQESFWEVVVAPQFDAEAKTALAVKERLRLFIAPPERTFAREISSRDGLFLMQEPDHIGGEDWKIPTKRQPTDKESADLDFAWRVVAAVKSNAIIIAKDKATLGIGAGQMSRLDSAWLACEKARRAKIKTKGAVAASDGFFPFPDGIEQLAKSGVTAIIQPGGSKQDGKVIEVADRLGISLILTGRRHFFH